MNHQLNSKTPTAQEIMSNIARSPEYLCQMQKNLGNRVVQFSLAAEQLANRHTKENHGYDTPTTLQEKMIGILPRYLAAQKQLDLHRDQMTREQKRETLEPVVKFNHILRETIDSEIFTTIPEVTTFTWDTLSRMRYSAAALTYAKQEVVGILDGMRHEIAVESVLSSLPGVIVRQGDGVDDEMKGRDLYITFQGKEFPVDIKSRKNRANEANAKSNTSNYLAVWSGFEWDDFGNKLIPPREILQQKSTYWIDTLHKVSSEGEAVAL